MSTGIFSIGITGMQVAQLGLLTTEHNIANANTPGFSRQRTIQGPNIAVMTGAGAIGQGAHVSTIERAYNRFLSAQVNSSQSSVSELDTYYSQVSQIDSMLADSSSGLSPALQDFFKGIQQVAANPSSLTSRQSMVSSAETLVSRFKSLEDRLTQLSNGVNSQITSTVGAINSYAEQIADLNKQITLAQSAAAQPANDLLDQRDQLVYELNKLIKVDTTTNSDGTFNVFIGTGQQLVVGTQVATMTATGSLTDPSRIVVGLQTAGKVQQLPESIITGGELGGLVQFRSESLDRSVNELGRVAASVALTFNAQNALGQDLLGQSAGVTGFVADFFDMTHMQPGVVGNANNSGSGAVQATFLTNTLSAQGNFSTDLTASDYKLQFGAGGSYTITRLSDNKTVATGSGPGNVAFDGINVNISAAGANGDNFVIQPTRNAAGNMAVSAAVSSDPRLIAAAMPFRTAAATANTGTGSISAGQSVLGYSSASLPAGGLTLSYDAGPPAALNGFPATANVSVVLPDGTTTVYPGSAPVPYTAGAKYTFDGISFEMSGQPNTGDSFTLTPNTAGSTDGRNAVLLGKLQSQGTTAGGTASYQTTYAQFVSYVANKTREVEVKGAAQQSVLEQAQNSQQSMAGVNLDEEAANLLRYQQAYQASARMLDIASKLFDTVLSIPA